MRSLRTFGSVISDVFTGVPESRPAPFPDPMAESFGSRLGANLLHRPRRLIIACLATVLAPAVVAQAGSLGPPPVPEVQAVIGPLDGPVPAPTPGDAASWLPLARRAAATCPGLSASVLVAISHLESSLGLHIGESSAGAVGPMQFLPSTWLAYGVDGDADGLADVMNPADAVHGAARLLCANGGGDPARLPSALWNYNHSDTYVRQVLTLARFVPVVT